MSREQPIPNWHRPTGGGGLVENIIRQSDKHRDREAEYIKLAELADKNRSTLQRIFGTGKDKIKQFRNKAAQAAALAEYNEDRAHVQNTVSQEIKNLGEAEISVLIQQAQKDFFSVNNAFLEFRRKYDSLRPSEKAKQQQKLLDLGRATNKAFFRLDTLSLSAINNFRESQFLDESLSFLKRMIESQRIEDDLYKEGF